MKSKRTAVMHLALALFAAIGLMGCDKKSANTAPQGDLQAAIKARTEAGELQLEVAKTDQAIRDLLRRVVSKADGKQTEGNVLLSKDRYNEAVEAFQEAARFYRQVADGKKVLGQIAKAERRAGAARMLAEVTASPEELKEGRRIEINAEGYLQAAEIGQALAEYEKARVAYEKLLPSESTATLEEAVAARTAMLGGREQIKALSQMTSASGDDHLLTFRGRLGLIAGTDAASAAKVPKPGSLADLLSRARRAESAAADALEGQQYTPARSLFVAAEKLYREAAVARGKREQVQASRKSVEDSLKLADAAFKGPARPAAFERGKQALADADKALGEDDIEAAKPLLARAAEQFAAARGQAEKVNPLGEAQQIWSAALAAADADLLIKHAAAPFQSAKATAGDAQAKAAAGQTEAATAEFKQAAAALAEAVTSARTKENFARLETAVAANDKFVAEDILAELEKLIPADARMAGLRDRVTAVPGPKLQLSIDLGDGVAMEFVLIRPGSFTMGSQSSLTVKNPACKVTLTQPFYLGKFEVTQEQWEKVMGNNPSNSKGPKLPVERVSWSDCQNFLVKLHEMIPNRKFALPTEAQWEYACRAGSTTKFSFGDDETTLGEYAWASPNAGHTHPVGEKKPNAWGLHDMLGNVAEWCADWRDAKSRSSEDVTDPQGPAAGSTRVYCGGSWMDSSRGPALALSNVVSAPTDFRVLYLGFRVKMGVDLVR